MNLVPKIKIEQITANLEAVDQQIKHAALSIKHDYIRNLIDQRRQLLADLETEIKLEQRQKAIAVDFAYTPNKQTILFITAWCNRIKNAMQTSFEDVDFCNLFLDQTLSKSWDFKRDVLVIHAPLSSTILHAATERGQKNIVVFDPNKTLQSAEIKWALNHGIMLCYTPREIQITFAMLQSPANKIITISCDPDPNYGSVTKPLITEAINSGKKNRVENTRTATKFGRSWSKNVIDNLHHMAEYPNFHQMDISGVENAVIVASGPSLTKNIDYLSQIQESVFIVSALRSLPLLHNANIRPDLVIQLDAEDEEVAENFLANLDYDIPNFLLELTVNQKFFQARAKQKICSLSRLFFDTHEKLRSKPIPFDAPSVSVYALYLCNLLKFKNICFVGQDLAADGCKQYADGATSLLPAHAKLSTFDIEVPGFYGDKVLTRSAYYHQIKKCSFIAKDLTEQISDMRLVNATEGGAYIDGFEHMSLKSFVKQQGLEGQPRTKSIKFSSAASASKKDVLSYLKTIRTSMKQTIKTADKIIKLDQEPNQHRGLQKKIEKEVSKFRSLNKTTSLLQIAMQENIAKVIGTSHEAQKISSYSEFFEKVKTNAQFLLQATDKQLRS
jgi:hypothetical protein